MSVTAQYLQQLRTGKVPDPKWSYVVAIAKLFRVKEEFFSDAEVTASFAAQIAELAALRDELNRLRALQAQQPADMIVALRSIGFSPKGITAALGVINNLLSSVPELRAKPSKKDSQP